MKRNFRRERGLIPVLPKEKVKIGVVGMGRNVGTTFVAMALAEEIALEKKGVAFIELEKGYEGRALSYDAISIGQRFSLRKYTPVFSEIQNRRPIGKIENWDSQINWALMTPEENMQKMNLSLAEQIHGVNNLHGKYIFCDLGHGGKEDLWLEMDLLVCVVDPLPSKVMGNRELFQRLNQCAVSVIWITNKKNKGVVQKSFSHYMRKKEMYGIPLLDEELFYKKEYNCQLPYEQQEIRKKMQPIMKKIVKEHIIIT